MPHPGNYLNPFTLMGSKLSKLNWLLPHLRVPADIFVDCYGGSGVVGLNRALRPKLQIYNDLDWELYNFFNQMRENPEELMWMIRNTAYSKNEFDIGKGKNPPARFRTSNNWGQLNVDLTPLEAARRFYIVCTMSYSGTRGAFGYSGARVGSARSAALTQINKVSELPRIIQKLRTFEIHNRPANQLIKMFKGNKEALIYLDPPYIPESWGAQWTRYKDNMSAEDHEEMLDLCLDADARIAISGYPSELYQEKLQLPHWRMESKDVKVLMDVAHGNINTRSETLWLNYNADGILLADQQAAGHQGDLLSWLDKERANA